MFGYISNIREGVGCLACVYYSGTGLTHLVREEHAKLDQTYQLERSLNVTDYLMTWMIAEAKAALLVDHSPLLRRFF